eukprot:Phypoly_transcript_10564.p1 GENE.Phypoly_transcript_10564~~Phypoly_transcript_10564.p1  ORF type:complete len:390 (+),score=58.37 Phypoly_transcript_10564:164-1171(+)
MGTQGVRYGVYTDDTNATLALASSIVENGNLVPKHAATQYGKFWKEPPFEGLPIGYPGSAQAAMQRVLDGKDYKQAGRGSFPEGSFANGGIMRIPPVGLAFRNATDEELHTAVQWAIISSHVHPEAIDGAWLQAKAISMLLKSTPDSMTPLEFVEKMRDLSRNEAMREQIVRLLEYIARPKRVDDKIFVHAIGDTFQLRAIDAFPNALWAVYHNWNNPEQCIIDAVNLGGDADTIGCIAGALIGALHGHKYVPSVWWSNINDTGRGRSYCVNIAKQLAALDLHAPVLTEEEKNYVLQPPKKESKTEGSEGTTEHEEVQSKESPADALSQLSLNIE